MENRFDPIGDRPSAAGRRIRDGVVASIDCRLHAVDVAGNHVIAMGKVREIDVLKPDPPLVFVQGAYGAVSPCSVE